MRILVTGGAGFIGSALVRHLIARTSHEVLNLDKLTYAANLESLEEAVASPRYRFVQADVADRPAVEAAFRDFAPEAVLHLAAESHVDRSIDAARAFVETNLLGTYVMLDVALAHHRTLSGEARDRFRFLHVSTDEVFGSLGPEGHFREDTPYDPRSPYSATKAGSDHLARAWFHTHGLPVLVTNCSNNYGPYQFPEKLIPLMILKALGGEPLPVYGRGENVRDWLHVDDHVRALLLVLERGAPGSTYTIGGRAERRNLDVVRAICAELDRLLPGSPHRPHEQLIRFVTDRPGHDLRYAIDPGRVERELSWSREHGFEDGLRATVRWYLEHRDWWERILDGRYRLTRLGAG